MSEQIPRGTFDGPSRAIQTRYYLCRNWQHGSLTAIERDYVLTAPRFLIVWRSTSGVPICAYGQYWLAN